MFGTYVLSQLATFAVRSQPKELQLNYVNKCCIEMSNSQNLLNCVNLAASSQTMSDSWHNNSVSKIAIVSYATTNIADYAAYAFAINQAYAEHNQYIFSIANETLSNYEPADARWNKVKIVEHALQTWARDSNYIIWLDADLIILDLSMRIEKIISNKKTFGEIWICASVEQSTNSNLMNSGFMILKNSEFVKTWLLPKWWNHNSRTDFNDQEVFDQIYIKYKESMNFKEKIIILEPDALNSGK